MYPLSTSQGAVANVSLLETDCLKQVETSVIPSSWGKLLGNELGLCAQRSTHFVGGCSQPVLAFIAGVGIAEPSLNTHRQLCCPTFRPEPGLV